MNYQKKPPEIVLRTLKGREILFAELDFYAWPQTFGNTAGPSGGIGGCAISTFTVEAYVCDGNGPTVYICNGMYHFEDKPFKGPGQRYKYHWIKIPKQEKEINK